MIIALLMGVPDHMHPDIVRWTDAMAAGGSAYMSDAAVTARQEREDAKASLAAYMLDQMAYRRLHPGNGRGDHGGPDRCRRRGGVQSRRTPVGSHAGLHRCAAGHRRAHRQPAEVYLDGGVRRGTDVITALCLGARGVFIGRPYLYGLAVRGEGRRNSRDLPGGDRAALVLMGCPSIAALDASWLVPPAGTRQTQAERAAATPLGARA